MCKVEKGSRAVIDDQVSRICQMTFRRTIKVHRKLRADLSRITLPSWQSFVKVKRTVMVSLF